MISIVAAMDTKRGIGKNNDLLFKIPEDFVRMKKLTEGHPIIMGRRTFESIGRILPNRYNIVITRDPDFEFPGLSGDRGTIVGSLEEAVTAAKRAPGSEEIIIFGGGQIFTEAVEKGLVDILHLTIVDGDFGADTFFPDYSQFTKILDEESGQSGEYHYRFVDLAKD
nr:Dihydrofolate reductase [uncultured bacterium]